LVQVEGYDGKSSVKLPLTRSEVFSFVGKEYAKRIESSMPIFFIKSASFLRLKNEMTKFGLKSLKESRSLFN